MTLESHVLFSVVVNAAVLAVLPFCRSAPPRLVLYVCLAGLYAAAVPWGLVGEWIAAADVVPHTAVLLRASSGPEPSVSAAGAVTAGRWTVVLTALWAGVAAVWLGITFARAARVRRRWRNEASVEPISGLAAAEPLRELARRVDVYRLPGCRNAFTTGLFRREIWLGADITDPVHLHVALNHELCHLAAGDQYVTHLVTIAERALWWNPLIWILGRIARRHLEYDCDQRCKRLLGERTYRRTLAELLLATAERWSTSSVATLHLNIGSPSGLVGRMERLTMSNTTRPAHRVVLAAAVGAVLLGAGALAADGPKPTLLACNEHLPQGVHYWLKIEYDPDTRGSDVHGNLGLTLLDRLNPGSVEVPEGSASYARCVLDLMGVPEHAYPPGV